MKNQIKHLLIALTLLSALNSQLATAFAQGTAFTMYVANSQGYGGSNTRYFTVEQFDSQGNASVFATNSSFSNPILSAPEAVAINSSGEKYDSGGIGTVFATSGIGFLEDLAFDAAGNLWVTDEYNGLVEVRDAGGTLTTFASPGHNPYGLAFDKSGNLYVALTGNGNIVKYDSNTNQTLVAALGSSAQPVGLAFDPAGNLYVTEYGINRIVKIDPQYNVTVFATNGLNSPLFLAIKAAAPTLTITYSGNQAIVSWSPAVTGWTLQTSSEE